MSRRNEMQMNFEVIAHTRISVPASPAFCTNMGWKGENWGTTQRAEAWSLFLLIIPMLYLDPWGSFSLNAALSVSQMGCKCIGMCCVICSSS